MRFHLNLDSCKRGLNLWASFLGLEKPSLKLLHSAELQRTISSRISNCRRLKSGIFVSCNMNSNINSLLWSRVETHISIERYILEVEMKII